MIHTHTHTQTYIHTSCTYSHKYVHIPHMYIDITHAYISHVCITHVSRDTTHTHTHTHAHSHTRTLTHTNTHTNTHTYNSAVYFLGFRVGSGFRHIYMTHDMTATCVQGHQQFQVFLRVPVIS
jgi:hypothetical protein